MLERSRDHNNKSSEEYSPIRWNPYINGDSTRQLNITRINKFSDGIHSDSTGVQLRHFCVHSGENVQTQQFADYQYPDTLDALLYTIDKHGEKRFVLVQSARPTIALRSHLAEGEPQSGFIWGTPGFYLKPWLGEQNLQMALATVVAKKTPFTIYRDEFNKESDPEFCGASSYPSLGISTELCFPRALHVDTLLEQNALEFSPDHVSGFGIYALKLATASEIVSGFLSGEYPDIRLLSALLHYDRLYDLGLSKKHFRIQPSLSELQTMPERIVPFTEAVDLLKSHSKDISVVACPLPKSENPFFEQLTFTFQDPQGSAFSAEAIARKTTDKPSAINSVDLLPVFHYKNTLYVQLAYSEQAAVVARQQAVHPLNSDSQVMQLHLLSRYVHPGENAEQAAQLILSEGSNSNTNESSLTACGEYFPSPGYLTEKVHAYLASPSSPLEGSNIITLELDTVLQLCEQGYIRCPRVSALALIAAKTCETKIRSHERTIFSTSEKADFLSLIGEGSHLSNWLLREAPRDTFDYLHYPRFRRLLHYLENERGLCALTPSDSLESRFFRAFVTIIGAFQSDEPWKWTSRVHHDMEHMLMGDLSPFIFDEQGKLCRDEQDKPLALSKEEWSKFIIESECEAVFRSDIEAPLSVGVNSGEANWRKDLAKSFAELGLGIEGGSDSLAARTIIQIERDLTIPVEFLKHPAFAMHRASILKLLQFGVLDRAQLSVFYDNWLECPNIAELAVEYGTVHSSVQTFQNWNDSQLYKHVFGSESTIPYSEGSNPLKAAISRVINVDCEVLSYRLAYIASEMRRENATNHEEAVARAENAIDSLRALRKVLVDIRSTVTDTEMSERNLYALRLLRSAEATVIAQAQNELAALKSDNRYLSEERIESLKYRSLEAFHSQFSHNTSQKALRIADVSIDLSEAPPLGPGLTTKLAVLRLEKKAFADASLSYPFQDELSELEEKLSQMLL